MDSSYHRSADSALLDRLDGSSFTSRHTRVYLTALSGHFFDGFTINITGFVLPGVIATFALTSAAAGVVSSAVFGGMLVGAAVAGITSDRLGRRFPLAFSVTLYGAFSLLAAAAWSFPVLVGARFVQGIGLGAEIAIVLPYIAEFVPTRHRGPLITLATAAWLIGLPVASVVAVGVVPALGWRAMFVIGAVPVLAGAAVATLPESVRYLLRRGRRDSAEVVVDWLTSGSTSVPAAGASGSAKGASPGTVDGTVDGVAASADAVEPAGSVRQLLRGRYRRYTLAIWVMELCAGAFLYGLSSWLPAVLKSRGLGLLSSFTYTGIITAAGVAGAVLAGRLVNQVGRRWAMAPGFVVSGLLCLLWGTVSGPAALVVTGALATFFGSGIAGSTLFVYVSELYPTSNRATGLGWAAAWQKVGGLVMPVTVGFVLSWHPAPYVFFVVFAVISILGGAAGLLATCETRGKSIEQIAAEMGSRGLSNRTGVRS